MCIHSVPMLISSTPGSCQRGKRFKRQLDTAVVEEMRIDVELECIEDRLDVVSDEHDKL